MCACTKDKQNAKARRNCQSFTATLFPPSYSSNITFHHTTCIQTAVEISQKTPSCTHSSKVHKSQDLWWAINVYELRKLIVDTFVKIQRGLLNDLGVLICYGSFWLSSPTAPHIQKSIHVLWFRSLLYTSFFILTSILYFQEVAIHINLKESVLKMRSPGSFIRLIWSWGITLFQDGSNSYVLHNPKSFLQTEPFSW